MNLLYPLRKIVSVIGKYKEANCSVEKQKQILHSFSEPKDNYERSYFQYICQNRKMGFLFIILSNLAGFFLLFFSYFKISLNNTSGDSVECEAIFFSNNDSKSNIPDTLHNEFKDIMQNENFEVFRITKEDKKFINKLWKKYPFSFYFIFKCMIKISMYSGQIQKYSPNTIITAAEHSFTSSILTTYCNSLNIEHINVMHGENLFNINSSFFRFDRCYVWMEFHKDLFIKLRAYNNQFIVEAPSSLNLNLNYSYSPIYDFTYYLGYENEAELRRIKDSIDVLKNQGKIVSVRPHPRYSNLTLISKIFRDFDVEDFSTISIKESLERTNALISLCSTVLLQGSYNKKDVVIDDLSRKEEYKKLLEADYIMMSRPHKLLSEVVN